MHCLTAMDVQAVDNRTSCSAVISNPEELHHCQLYKHVIDKIRVASVLNKAPRYPELWEKEEQLGYIWH
jgi:hypothetical protein